MRLGRNPSFVLIVASAVITPLIIMGIFSIMPSSWIDTTIGLVIVLSVLNLVVVGVVSNFCFHVIETFGVHQVLVFSITAFIVTRVKQLLLSTSQTLGIIEAGTLFGACLLVFFVTLLIQRKKQE